MGIESVMVKLILVGAFVVGLLLIIPSRRERTYLLRGEVLTLKQIAEKLCEDGVLVCQEEDEIQMAYDHDPDAIPAVLKILAEAEMPAMRFKDSIVVQCPVIFGD